MTKDKKSPPYPALFQGERKTDVATVGLVNANLVRVEGVSKRFGETVLLANVWARFLCGESLRSDRRQRFRQVDPDPLG